MASCFTTMASIIAHIQMKNAKPNQPINSPEIINYLSNIVGAVIPVRSIADMKKAFEMDIQKSFGKTIMLWEK